MMTSALLNMLDTPEEVGGDFEDDPRLVYGNYESNGDDIDPSFFERLSLSQGHPADNDPRSMRDRLTQDTWSGVRATSVVAPSDSDDAVRAMQQHHATRPPFSDAHSHSGGDVGLYLP